MYSQVRILLRYSDMFRYVWRDCMENDMPRIMKHNRLCFGAKAAPYQALFVLRAHAKMLAAEYPLAAAAVHNATYVDDICLSMDSPQMLKETREQLTAMLKRAGMTLRKFQSNSSSILQGVEDADKAADECSVLGIPYQASTDTLRLNAIKIAKPRNFETKRSMLSQIASLYDQTTFFQPFIIRARKTIQKLWLNHKLNWDDPITDPEILDEYLAWKKELVLVEQFSLPRWIFGPHEMKKLDLSAFGAGDDALHAHQANAVSLAAYSKPRDGPVSHGNRQAKKTDGKVKNFLPPKSILRKMSAYDTSVDNLAHRTSSCKRVTFQDRQESTARKIAPLSG